MSTNDPKPPAPPSNQKQLYYEKRQNRGHQQPSQQPQQPQQPQDNPTKLTRGQKRKIAIEKASQQAAAEARQELKAQYEKLGVQVPDDMDVDGLIASEQHTKTLTKAQEMRKEELIIEFNEIKKVHTEQKKNIRLAQIEVNRMIQEAKETEVRKINVIRELKPLS